MIRESVQQATPTPLLLLPLQLTSTRCLHGNTASLTDIYFLCLFYKEELRHGLIVYICTVLCVRRRILLTC